MTEEELAAIRERLAKATPGPWEIEDFDVADHRVLVGYALGVGRFKFDPEGDLYEADEPDVLLIAHAPTDIAALLAEVERLQVVVRGFLEPRTDSDQLCEVDDWREYCSAHEMRLPCPVRLAQEALGIQVAKEEPS